jgi:hypothetical protein
MEQSAETETWTCLARARECSVAESPHEAYQAMRGVAFLTAVTFVTKFKRCATFRHTTINGLSRFGPLGTLDR